MGLPVFFKLQKNKRFNFVPRYYDERKEELKKKVEKIKQEIEKVENPNPSRDVGNVETLHATSLHSSSTYVPNIKGQFRRYYQRKANKSKQHSNIRLIIIIIVLFLIAYYLLFY